MKTDFYSILNIKIVTIEIYTLSLSYFVIIALNKNLELSVKK